MTSMPATPMHEPAPPSKREGEERRPDELVRDSLESLKHKARVRRSLDWALDEYASTLAKLAK